MNVLLIGSGGREHALAWKLAQSPTLDKLFIAPGNGGMGTCGEMVAIDVNDHKAVSDFCKLMTIDLVVVGPEAPLVAGLADHLQDENISVFGPSQKAAQLEGSKHFTKSICDRMNIPTSAYGHFTNGDEARAYVEKTGAPIVIKADGLAAGKGVTVAMNLAEALAAIDDCFDGAFGKAGAEVVVEEFLSGEEASMFFLWDGKSALPFGTAQDHKRVGEGDAGPNTGGMGAYSPAPVLTQELQKQVLGKIIEPTLKGMAEIGAPFSGVLYAGLMIEDGVAKLIEYNVRFGDPECQVLMMRLESDLLPILQASADGNLENTQASWCSESALTVVLASNGYPNSYKKGSEINGLDGLNDEVIHVFHAGTQRHDNLTQAIGGRVLNVTAIGEDVTQAQKRAYAIVDKIDWPEGFCRRDIGWRAIEREKKNS